MTTTVQSQNGESCTKPKNSLSRIVGTLRHGKVVRDKRLQAKGRLYDTIMVNCRTNQCPMRGQDAVVEIRVDGETILVRFTDAREFCQHMWQQARAEVDEELDLIREDMTKKWCPKCLGRVPREMTVCPECETVLI